MLQALYINNIVIIDSAELHLSSGFSVFTGETGAGKSLLIDALSFVVGGKAENSLIRYGENIGFVKATFDIQRLKNFDEIVDFLKKHSIPAENGKIVIQRTIAHSARNKVFVNDQSVSLSTLKTLGSYLIEFHGQNDHVLSPNRQKYLLDKFTDFLEYSLLKDKFHQWQHAQQKLRELFNNQQKWQDNFNFLQQQLHDLELLQPKENEESLLLLEREKIASSAKMQEYANEALNLLQKPNDIAFQISLAFRCLDRANLFDYFDETKNLLDQARIYLQESLENLTKQANSNYNAFSDQLKIDERLQSLRSMGKKYHTAPDLLADLYQKIQTQINMHADFDHLIVNLEKNLATAKNEYLELAEKLTIARQKAARELQDKIMKEMAALCLPNAQLKILITPNNEWHADGIDKVEFFVAMNANQDFNPLHKVASGGEMARLMLAIKVNLPEGCTIIFDEIDSNVGGQAAAAIGKRLNKLGHNIQVFAITHTPQVTAYADHHWKVEKNMVNGQIISAVNKLDEKQSQMEIARMLSGDQITEVALLAAQELTKIAKSL
jgi:DNA repair protein RecN (Recombination protein N)